MADPGRACSLATPSLGLDGDSDGIDCGFRDPSGNSFRLTQVMLPATA